MRRLGKTLKVAKAGAELGHHHRLLESAMTPVGTSRLTVLEDAQSEAYRCN
jgi:hypothetical protein